MKYKTKTNIAILSALVIFVVFYAGMKYGQTKGRLLGGAFLNGQGFQQMRGQPGATGNRTFSMRGVGISGQILSLDDKSMTVQQKDGSSKIIFLAESTLITKATPGTTKDLVLGQQVTITSTPNPDGSQTAQSIQIKSDQLTK